MSSSASELIITEKLRWHDWLAGDAESFLEMRGQMRSDRFPDEWADLVVDQWLSEDITRESESSADVSSIELILQFLRKAFLAAPGM